MDLFDSLDTAPQPMPAPDIPEEETETSGALIPSTTIHQICAARDSALDKVGGESGR